MQWLLIWFAIVFGAAVAKPDKDIRYLYMALPVLAIFAAYTLDMLARRFRWHRMVVALSGFILLLSFFFNYGPPAKPDTRPQIEILRAKLVDSDSPLIALGGYPIEPDQPRRQNTHRDWIYFYMGIEPIVLDWTQLKPESIETGAGYFLTNNRSHKTRLKEYKLNTLFTTTEMVYAVRK